MTNASATPSTPADLVRDLETQSDELTALLQSTDDSRLTRRPAEGRWAAIEHVDHLVKVNEGYAEALTSALAKGKTSGRTGIGPFRGSVLGRYFARSMEPPVRTRMKTLRAMVPDAALEIEPTRIAFEEVQGHLRALIESAASDSLDLDRIRLSSPFLPLIRAPVFSWFCVLTAHTRRHIWLIRETLEQV